MGAPTVNRKRSSPQPIPAVLSPIPPSKKPKLFSPTPDACPPFVDLPGSTETQIPSTSAHVPRVPPIAPLRRAVHGPQRNLNVFGLGSSNSSRSNSSRPSFPDLSRFGSFSFSRVLKIQNSGTPWRLASSLKKKRFEEIYDEIGLEEYRKLVDTAEKERNDVTINAELLTSAKVIDLVVEDEKGEDVEMVSTTPEKEEDEFVKKSPLYLDLLGRIGRYDSRIESLDGNLKLEVTRLSEIRALYPVKEDKPEEVEEELEGKNEVFLPLTVEEENEVNRALYGRKRNEILVTHEASNIVITREVMQCLSSSNWLNDEVINVYLELLKEREIREPKKFLKCHFFNTFFFKKLTSGKGSYDFKSVRRWTTQRKLGYSLIECDKIFVPIHKDIHWCLAIIDVKEKKFLYLDSLGGKDTKVLRVLARYLMDEVKDKSNKQIDTLSWKQEGVAGLPLQKNGWDCGMFMLKYTDFYSRGSTLFFSQDNMPYFRTRMVKEILRLRAE